jgi:hypothetical protein
MKYLGFVSNIHWFFYYTGHHFFVFWTSNTVAIMKTLASERAKPYYEGKISLGTSSPANPAFSDPEPCS